MTQRGLFCVFVLALFAGTGCQKEQRSTNSVPTSEMAVAPVQMRIITHSEFEALENSDQEIFVLDVRTPNEYAQSHVPGAVNIPYNELSNRLNEVAAFKDKTIIAYCESGGRTRIALDILKRNGYRDLGHLEGDMSAWRRAGNPVD